MPTHRRSVDKMRRQSCFALLFCGLFLPGILTFPQTNTSIDCESLLPNYEAEPQKSAPPYIIAVSFDNFEAGNEIQVTLEALQGVGFKGFNLQAREIEGDVPIGTFKITDTNTKGLECHNETNSALSHANSDVKQKITTSWIAPQAVGDLHFIATVVQDLEKYWVGIQSKTLTSMRSESVNGTGKSKRKMMIELECNKRGGTYSTQGGCVMIAPSGSSQKSYSGGQSGVVYTISKSGCGPGGAAGVYSQQACRDSAFSSSGGLTYGQSVPSSSSDSSKKVVIVANSNPFPPVRHTYPQSLGSSATRIIIQSGQKQQTSSTYVQGSQGSQSYGQSFQPQGGSSYGQSFQPQGGSSYGQGSQPQGGSSYGQGSQGSQSYSQSFQPQGGSSYGQGSQGSQSYGQSFQPQGGTSYGQGGSSSSGSSGCGQGVSYDSNPCHQGESYSSSNGDSQDGSSYSQNYGSNQGGSFSQSYGGGNGGSSSSDGYYDSQGSSDDNPNACDDNETTYSAKSQSSGCGKKKVVARDTSHVLRRSDYDVQNESSTSNSSHTNLQGGSFVATSGESSGQGDCTCPDGSSGHRQDGPGSSHSSYSGNQGGPSMYPVGSYGQGGSSVYDSSSESYGQGGSSAYSGAGSYGQDSPSIGGSENDAIESTSPSGSRQSERDFYSPGGSQSGGHGSSSQGGGYSSGQGLTSSGGRQSGGQGGCDCSGGSSGSSSSGGSQYGSQGSSSYGGSRYGGQVSPSSGGSQYGGQGQPSSGGIQYGGQGPSFSGGSHYGGQGYSSGGRQSGGQGGCVCPGGSSGSFGGNRYHGGQGSFPLGSSQYGGQGSYPSGGRQQGKPGFSGSTYSGKPNSPSSGGSQVSSAGKHSIPQLLLVFSVLSAFALSAAASKWSI